MQQLLWVDWVIIVIVMISSLISLKRGFVRECLSLATWVAAFFIARLFSPNLETILVDSIATPSLRYIAAFAILFVCVLIVGGLIGKLVYELVKITGLTTTDRLLGMVFGMARGLVLSVFAVAILRLTPVEDDEWWNQSIAIEKLQMLETWSRKTIKESTL